MPPTSDPWQVCSCIFTPASLLPHFLNFSTLDSHQQGKYDFWENWLRRIPQCPLLYIFADAQAAFLGKCRNSLFLLVCNPERNSIFFLHKSTPCIIFRGGIGELPKEEPSVLGLRGNLWHTSSLLVTLQDSLSPPQIDMFASYRFFKGQFQI